MKRFLTITLLLSSFFLWGCTTRTILQLPHSDYCNNGVILTRSVNDGRASYQVDQVTSDDAEIIALVACANLHRYHRLRWEWYTPEGNVYETATTTLSASYGKFSRYASAWHALKIRGTSAESLPGDWRVKVFVDNGLISSSNFQLVSNVKHTVTGAAPFENEPPVQRNKSNPFAGKPAPKPPTSGINVK